LNDKKLQSSRLIIGGGIITAIATFIILWQFPVLTHHFELLIFDLKFNMRSYMEKEPEMSSDVVLVALDDNSKIASGHPYLWPYDYYAETVKKITNGDPTSFGMDIIFTNTVDATGWDRLIDELGASYMAVNPYVVKFGDKDEPLEVGLHRDIIKELTMDKLPIAESQDLNHVEDIIYKTNPKLQEVSSGMGFANIQPDQDGVLRRLPIVAELNGMLVPHLFLKLLCEHFAYELGNIELASPYKLILHNFPHGDSVKNIEIPLDGYGNMLINYMSFDKIQYQKKKGEFRFYSAWELIQHRKALDFKEKTVLFGDHSLAARDLSSTPLDGEIYNPLIFCIAMSNIINKSFLKPISGLASIYQIIFLVIVLLICATRLKAFEFGLLSIGILILYTCINFILFVNNGLQVQLLHVLIPVLTSASYLLIYSVYHSQVKMGVLEGSLQSYLSPHLMDKMKNDPDMLKLGGERKRITVLFSDIAGFTSFTDQADPAEVQSVLEEYFSEMTSIVFANKGIVDKYMGDGILAFFENPPDGVTSAQAAIKSAVAMQEKAVELDKKYQAQKRFPFAIYVCIATGYAKVGNIGPPEKVDYTVIGSVVNKASRLDGPGNPGDILMDEDTFFFVKDDYEIEDFGSHELKGFEKLVQIYKLKAGVSA
jgi:adenylate cyclase